MTSAGGHPLAADAHAERAGTRSGRQSARPRIRVSNRGRGDRRDHHQLTCGRECCASCERLSRGRPGVAVAARPVRTALRRHRTRIGRPEAVATSAGATRGADPAPPLRPGGRAGTGARCGRGSRSFRTYRRRVRGRLPGQACRARTSPTSRSPPWSREIGGVSVGGLGLRVANKRCAAGSNRRGHRVRRRHW